MPGHHVFDGPSFARLFRNHMDTIGLGVQDVADRAGLSRGMIQTLRRGTPASPDRRRGQTTINPQVNTLASIADAVDLRLSFMLSWGGITDSGDRFTAAELRVLADVFDCDPASADSVLRERARSMSNSKEPIS